MSITSFNSSTNSPIICSESWPAILVFTAFSVTNIFIIPLFVYILCTGFRRWRNRRSASKTTSNLDIFTYNVVALELLSLVGCCCFCCGALMGLQRLISVGHAIFTFTSPGQSYFHVITCVERYLAVVYPIAYRRLRHGSGTRIRTAAVGGIWLLCFVIFCLDNLLSPMIVVIRESYFFAVFIIIVTFCSFSVLRILIHPKPGEMGGEADQSKRRALNVITLIMGVLWLRFLGVLVGGVVSDKTSSHAYCILGMSTSFLTTPGSLVLPLLFLKQAGKVQRCK